MFGSGKGKGVTDPRPYSTSERNTFDDILYRLMSRQGRAGKDAPHAEWFVTTKGCIGAIGKKRWRRLDEPVEDLVPNERRSSTLR